MKSRQLDSTTSTPLLFKDSRPRRTFLITVIKPFNSCRRVMSYGKRDLTISREWTWWVATQMASNINNLGLTSTTSVVDLNTLLTNSSWPSSKWKPCRWCSSSSNSTLMLWTCTKGFSLTTCKAGRSQFLTPHLCSSMAQTPRLITFKWASLIVVLTKWWCLSRWTWCNNQACPPSNNNHLFLWSLLPGLKLRTWQTNKH